MLGFGFKLASGLSVILVVTMPLPLSRNGIKSPGNKTDLPDVDRSRTINDPKMMDSTVNGPVTNGSAILIASSIF